MKIKVRKFDTAGPVLEVEIDHVSDCPACEAARSVKFTRPGDLVFLEALEHPRGLCRIECCSVSPLAVLCIQVTAADARSEIAGRR